MPITAEQMTYEEMVKTASNHVCGICGGRLNVAWSAKDNGYILRCNDLTHDIITRHLPKSERTKQAEKEWNATNKMDSTALTTMTESTMIERIGLAKFPQDLTVQDKKLLAQVAISYGFDPLMGEISIFQGRPYVSIDGRYRKAQETGELDGVDTRPATRQEKTDWQIPDGDFFFRAEVYKRGTTRPFVGWGRVRAAEINPAGKFKPVDLNPQRIAEKRAEAQGLRKAFFIPLPSIEDLGTPEAEVPYIDGEVIKESGEIIDKPNNRPNEADAKAMGQAIAKNLIKDVKDDEPKSYPPENLHEAMVTGEPIKAPVPPAKITPEQIARLKEFRANYTVGLAPYIKNKGADIKAVDQLTEKQAGEIIAEIEAYLKEKGVI